jgi:AcrR family transcriptional regulator
MTRLTRSQVQEQNREIVLNVARTAFLRDGYVATSVASVAREAGFTTGIVYSSFGSKGELAVRVLDQLQAEQIDALNAQVRLARSPGEVLANIGQWATQATESGWVRFELELLLDTMNDPKLAADQTIRQEAAVSQAVEVLRSLAPAVDVDNDVIETLAEAAVNYAIGVAVRHMNNPAASPEKFLKLIAPLIISLTRVQAPA